jgi:hypothetical protein
VINKRLMDHLALCLPLQGSNDQYESQMDIVKGWGATGEDEGGSEVLLHAIKTIISNSQCQKIHAEAKITTRMMCAYRRGKDTCQVSPNRQRN